MDPSKLNLADFYFSDTSDPVKPPADFTQWRKDGAWAMSLLEPLMLGSATPHLEVMRAGKKHKVINMASYNYLGMATHPEVKEAAIKAIEKYGTGACGSPILSGMTDLHRELEGALASFLKREDAMLYNSGFGGALGAIAGMMRKSDVAVLDSKCHLCTIDGATLSQSKKVMFEHNNPASLEEALQKTEGKRRLIILEGVYSMDGDMADLPKIVEIAKRHQCSIFIDEAHSILAWGAHGRGVVEHYGVEDDVQVAFATFSKSFAGIGGFVSGPKELIDYLRFYSNPYGFSCALPPSVVAGLLKVLEINQRDPSFREQLWENTTYFRTGVLSMGIDIGHSTTQVVPIVIGSDRQMLYELCHEMTEKGLFMAPVDYPSVAEGQLRYRAAVTAAHTQADLDTALQILEDTVVRRLRQARSSHA